MTFFRKSSVPTHRYFNKSNEASKTFFSKKASVKRNKHHYEDDDKEEKKKVSPLEKHHR